MNHPRPETPAELLPVSAIVIDLDGTLLHTAPELAESANRMLREMGRPAVSQELLMSYIGNGISWLVKRALTGSLRHGEAEPSGAGGGWGRHSRTNRSRAPGHAADMHAEPDAALYNQALPIFEKHYTELLLHSKPFGGVIEGLDEMKAAGFRLGCITNKVARYTEPLLKGLGLADYFEIVLSGDSLPEKKPHPMPLLHAAKFFGVPAGHLLLIGDSLNDVAAARAAGCPVFCVPYGYNHGEPVDGLDLDAVIENLSAALKLIKRA
jgi:phosphoglycolate phosphatase